MVGRPDNMFGVDFAAEISRNIGFEPIAIGALLPISQVHAPPGYYIGPIPTRADFNSREVFARLGRMERAGRAPPSQPEADPGPPQHMNEQTRIEFAPKMSLVRADSAAQCSICLENVNRKAIVHSCFHQFCHICIFEWYKQKSVCPVCRQDIQKIMYNIQSDLKYDECSLPKSENLLENGRVRISISFQPATPENPDGPMQEIVLSRPSPTPPSELAHRLAQVNLYQILGTLHENNPNLGFPPARIDYKTFIASANFQADPTAMPDYYRCFVYVHNYAPMDNFRMTRKVGLKFFQENPSLIHRLITFVKCEFQAFRRAFNFAGYIDILCDKLLDILKTTELCSKEFQNKFRHIVNENLPVHSFRIYSYDLVDKLYNELVCFSKSPFTEHQDYVLNVSYNSNSTFLCEPQLDETKPLQDQKPLPLPAIDDKSTIPLLGVSSSESSPPRLSFPASISDMQQGETEAGTNAQKQQVSSAAIAPNQEPNELPQSNHNIETITISSSSSSESSDSVEWIPPTEFYSKPKVNAESVQGDESEVRRSPAQNEPLLLSMAPMTPLVQVASPPTPASSVATIPIELLKPGPSGLQPMVISSDDDSVICVEEIENPKAFKRAFDQWQVEGPHDKGPEKNLIDNHSYPRHKRILLPSKRPRLSKAPVKRTKYSQLDLMGMRRIIRKAPHSPYFYRKLLREVEKKFCNFETILNTPQFSHMQDFFKDVFCNAKLFRPRTLSCDFGHRKQAMTSKELQQSLDLSRKAAKRLQKSDTTDSGESDVDIAKYETLHREKMSKMVINHMTSQTMPPRIFMVQLYSERINFINHVYTSSEE